MNPCINIQIDNNFFGFVRYARAYVRIWSLVPWTYLKFRLFYADVVISRRDTNAYQVNCHESQVVYKNHDGNGNGNGNVAKQNF